MIGQVSEWLGARSWRTRGAVALAGVMGGLACASTASAASPNTYLSVFAGTGSPYYPSPGPAASSHLYNPHDVAVDPATGDVYIADYNNYEVEKVTPQGTLSVFAGNGHYGAPVPGPATSSPLGGPVQTNSTTIESGPTGVAVDPTNGDVYIADPANDVIERVTPDGTLSIAAGTSGIQGLPSSGDLNSPYGVTVDSSGDLFIADYGNAAVEEVTPNNPSALTVVAGTPGISSKKPTPGPATSVALDDPSAVAVDSAGDLYIADPYANAVEKVTPGSPAELSIFAGTETAGAPTNGAGASSTDLNFPSGVVVDPATGDVYIAAYGNNEIEQVTPAGTLSVFAGTGAAGLPTPGLATSSALDNPFGVALNPSTGEMYIADTSNDEVEQVGPWSAPVDSTPPSVSGTARQGKTLTAGPGSWANVPTQYAYQWEHCSGSSCTNITGATGTSYKLAASDVGHAIRVVVTASNPGGSQAVASAATAVVSAAAGTGNGTSPGSSLTHCPAASGRLTGVHLGRITLGMTRAKARRAMPKHTTGNGFDRFCLKGGRGILAAYPSKGLRKILPAKQRKQLSGRVVLVLTSNRHYQLDHIKAGSRVARVRGRLAHAQKVRLGATTWYLLRGSKSTGVVKVQHGTVKEIGIANRSLTAPRAKQQRLLSGF